jgi:hypothetical protein
MEAATSNSSITANNPKDILDRVLPWATVLNPITANKATAHLVDMAVMVVLLATVVATAVVTEVVKAAASAATVVVASREVAVWACWVVLLSVPVPVFSVVP